ncbi:hypothetical protein CF327_g2974 [Tilletia walkeri]|uniref:Uncharacterized protein n=1 Tax=Tilletia walkeri TaxID=117179 RepID=A0A8X7T614_9BASI|nr:hypothetical protein CF327_g2974 [Tilletia walkeri]KAE8270252.1 hypothetical protein A4X09_0g2088 [Tilletia walkeri]
MPITFDQVQTGLRSLSDRNATITQITNQINVMNTIFQGPKLAQELTGYCQQMSTELLQPLSDEKGTVTDPAKASAVVESVKTFVTVAKKRNDIIVGKFGLLSMFAFHHPVGAALRAMEASGDCLLNQLIGYVPSQAEQLKNLAAEWNTSTEAAVKVYSPTPF